MRHRGAIKQEIDQEEAKFRKTLKDGLREFEKISQQSGRMSGKDVFLLLFNIWVSVRIDV